MHVKSLLHDLLDSLALCLTCEHITCGQSPDVSCKFITPTDFPDIVWCLRVKRALFSHPGGSVKHHRDASW